MKSLYLTFFLALCGLIFGSGIGYVVEDIRLRSARRDLATLEEQAFARAVERRAATFIPGVIYMSAAPTISREDRDHIEHSKLENQSTIYRRGLAGRFFVGGILAAIALVLFCAYRDPERPNQSLQPTAPSGRG